MRQTVFVFCFLLLLVSTNQASAQSNGGGGIYFEETFAPVYVNRNDTGSYTTAPGVAVESGLGYDFRTTLGYAVWNQLFVGLTYNYYSLQTKRANVSGGDNGLDETTSKTELGPTLGWLGSSWRVLFTFFISGDRSVATKNYDDTSTTVDNKITNTGITGFQLVVGYTFALSPNFHIGPTLAYRNTSFSKQAKTNALNATETYADTSLFSSKVEATLDPMISLIVRF